MPRIIYNTAATLDGFLADPDDSLDWLFAVPGAEEAEGEFASFLAHIGAFVMGSTTYRWVLDQEERERPGMWAEAYGDLPCFVVTTRTDLPVPEGGNVRFVGGDAGQWLPQVVAAAGDRDVWIVGGGDLVGQIADLGRLDEVRVSVAPAVLGAGKPLLPRRIGADRLSLRSARSAGQFAELVYDVSAPDPR